MRGPEVADGERYVIQALAHWYIWDGGAADWAPSELSVKLAVAVAPAVASLRSRSGSARHRRAKTSWMPQVL